MSFGQAFVQALLIFAKAIRFILLPSAVGLLGGYLITIHQYVSLAVLVLVAVLVGLIASARDIQRRAR